MTDVWGNFTNGTAEYAIESFAALEPWVYPLLFVGIIGYIYTSMHSVTSAVVAIIITLGLFGVTTSLFTYTPEITQLFYIISIMGITSLIVTMLMKHRGVS